MFSDVIRISETGRHRDATKAACATCAPSPSDRPVTRPEELRSLLEAWDLWGQRREYVAMETPT